MTIPGRSGPASDTAALAQYSDALWSDNGNSRSMVQFLATLA
jgi:hypothetical protein